MKLKTFCALLMAVFVIMTVVGIPTIAKETKPEWIFMTIGTIGIIGGIFFGAGLLSFPGPWTDWNKYIIGNKNKIQYRRTNLRYKLSLANRVIGICIFVIIVLAGIIAK